MSRTLKIRKDIFLKANARGVAHNLYICTSKSEFPCNEPGSHDAKPSVNALPNLNYSTW